MSMTAEFIPQDGGASELAEEDGSSSSDPSACSDGDGFSTPSENGQFVDLSDAREVRLLVSEYIRQLKSLEFSPMRPDGLDRRYAAYGEKLRECEMVDDVLKVPCGFFGAPSLPLWLHPNYLVLEDYIGRSHQLGWVMGAPPKTQFHLVGTPGIGKSYFGHYWFFKQAKDRKKVIWRTKGDTARFIYYDFSLDQPFVLRTKDYEVPYSWEEDIDNVWLIVDGASKGVDHIGPILQCVSPGRDGYHEFAKDKGVIVHLEAWSLDDLKRCRDAVGLTFSDEQLEERFYICGGLPREVFDARKSSDRLKEIMSSAADGAPSWEEVIRHAVGDTEKDPCISHYLLHYKLPTEWNLSNQVSDKVETCTLTFGSEYVAQLVYNLYQDRGLEHAKQFFDFCQEIPKAQSLAGKFFQKHVHKILAAGGGEYRIRPLQQMAFSSTIELKPKCAKRLRRWEIMTQVVEPSGRKKQKLAEVGFTVYSPAVSAEDARKLGTEEAKGLSRLPADCFVEPFSGIQKFFDSLMTPDIIFQLTVSLDHKLFWSGIEEIIHEYDAWYRARDLALPEFYKLIFIVPESKFSQFQFQEYKKDDGKDYERQQSGMSRINQFVVAVPWKV